MQPKEAREEKDQMDETRMKKQSEDRRRNQELENSNNNNREAQKCPRCDSMNTKFCYYNNYNLSQPRHYCKTCRRYWTHGGALRNVPVGGASRKGKRAKTSSAAAADAPGGYLPLIGTQPQPLTQSETLTTLLQGFGGAVHHGQFYVNNPNPSNVINTGSTSSSSLSHQAWPLTFINNIGAASSNASGGFGSSLAAAAAMPSDQYWPHDHHHLPGSYGSSPP